jgi:hypothetical protein
MYDPTVGQFIGEDPIGFEAGDSNLRRYVGNSPTNLTDPSGLQPPIFPQGRAPATSPDPIGVFSDGSTRTIDDTIDPIVLEQMRRGGSAPSNVHRPWAPFGLPPGNDGSTAIDRPWTLSYNFKHATGDLIYSYQAIDISGSGKSSSDVLAWLKDFRYFNNDNIASVRLASPGGFATKEQEGELFALFHPTPLGEMPSMAGALNSAQYFVNPNDVAVRLFSTDSSPSVMAGTLGNHMISGVRKWTVTEGASGLTIETEAWEQRNGQINDSAMHLGGKDAMGGIWVTYLTNMARAATANGGSFGKFREYWDSRIGGQNPFIPGLPGSGVYGPSLPPGYHGRGRAK